MQRVHHKFEKDESEERQKGEGKQKKRKTPQSESNLGEIWEVSCQCGSRRTPKINEGAVMVDAAKRKRQKGTEGRNKSTAVYNREKLHDKI